MVCKTDRAADLLDGLELLQRVGVGRQPVGDGPQQHVALEEAFVEVAADYSQTRGLSRAAWWEAGVPAEFGKRV